MSIVRQRRVLVILVAITLLIGVNWFLNLEKEVEQRRRSIRIAVQSRSKLNEATANDIYYSTSNEITASDVIINNLTRRSIQSFSKLSRADLKEILNVFYINKVCLLDLNVLKYVNYLSSIESGYNDIFEILKLNDYFDDLVDKQIFLTFGAGYLRFKKLYKDLIAKISSKCNVIKTRSTKSNRQDIPTALYIECYALTFQICVVYRRGTFLWIPSDGERRNQTDMKIFGDLPRAFQKFELKEIKDKNLLCIYIPHNIDKFLFDYGHSKFLECNKHLAKYNLKIIGPKYKQDEKKNSIIAPVIQHITLVLESLRKHYWLAGGTLLGWYRDCGVIPYTQDVDIALWAHEYDERIKEKFLGNKVVRVWSTLGLINDSFEFRLFNGVFTFDMFLVYRFNETDQWCGYQVNRTKYRRFLPYFDELCSAELLNQKLMVPCDPEAYLEKEYGSKRWRTPQSKNYQWDNVKYWTNWSDVEWIRTVRYYDKEGRFAKNKTLEHINRFLSVNITAEQFDQINLI